MAFAHVQVRFCLQNIGNSQSSLGSRIKVERIDFDDAKLKHYKEELLADTEDKLKEMEKFTVNEVGTGKADLVVYMADNNAAEGAVIKGVLGRAVLKTVCNPDKSKSRQAHSINEWQETTMAFGSVSVGQQLSF